MGEIVHVEQGNTHITQRMSKEQVLDRIAMIQQIMQDPAIMKEGVHFGPPNGKKNNDQQDDDKKLKKVLLQPGAEKLLTTFRLAASFPEKTKTIGEDGGITYDVRCDILDQQTGAFLGSEWGTCSSYEEKYMWKACYIEGEFNAAKESDKRLKWKSGYRGAQDTTVKQIRVNPADVANTILAMSCKRAKVRATRAALAASDIFEVNTEDLPEDLQREFFGEDDQPAKSAKPSEALNRRQNPQSAQPQPQRFDVTEMLAKCGLTEPGDDGKQKPSREGFSFLNKLGVPKSWKAWTTEDKSTVFNALTAKVEEMAAADGAPEPGNDMPDIMDPFQDQ
jgi:hypothetical protein